MKARKSIYKNNRLHFEGEINERTCNKQGCLHCKQSINKGDGYKVITPSTFEYVHIDCLSQYEKNNGNESLDEKK